MRQVWPGRRATVHGLPSTVYNFGLVDADVGFTGLGPGVYRLRVRVTDGTRTSSSDESLTVTS